ncbi:hypothetical protein [Sphingomonas sp.]|uniref:hypothetical protein n=1 Tax=Sphingomonas sp. TaxID=28214 RepID=UPI0035C79FA6
MRAFLLLALLATPAFAQTGESARESADRFELDLAAPEDEAADTAVTGGEAPRSEPAASTVEPDSVDPAPEVAPAEDAVADVPPPARAEAPASFSADTPIEALIADKRSKAVLDWHMPGLSTDKNLAKFNKMSLRQLAPLSGGRLTPDLLKKVSADLEAIK